MPQRWLQGCSCSSRVLHPPGRISAVSGDAGCSSRERHRLLGKGRWPRVYAHGRGHGCPCLLCWQVFSLLLSCRHQPGGGCRGEGCVAGCGTSRGAGGRCAPPLAPSCRQTRSYGKHMAGNPVPDGYLLPLRQPPAGPRSSTRAQPGGARRCGWMPTGDSPKISPGSPGQEDRAGCRWHGSPALCSRAETPCGARAAPLGPPCDELCEGSARTEPVEDTGPCLAGHGLKLGLGGQNLANELMAIN